MTCSELTDTPQKCGQPAALTVLRQVFGYQTFRTGQERAIQATLSGRDSLLVMATGSGKSLCYQVPALCFDGLTLVISPLISLMKDQVDQLKSNGVEAAFLNSSQSSDEQQQVQSRAINGSLKLLYISPEKVMTQSFYHFISQCKLSFIAIDEAHCISQWGHDFRPEYSLLGGLKISFPAVPMMALTATADRTTRLDILQLLKLDNPYEYIGSFDRTNIRYTLMEKYKGVEQMCQFVLSQKGKCGIVYCNSRAKTEKLCESLKRRGISCAPYHAGLSQQQREATQHAFQHDDIQVVVATVAFGMGINKSNVRFVLHFDLPRSIEAYYQETGRAGRDDLPAEAVLLYDPADYAWLNKILLEKPEGTLREIEQHKLQAIGAFAEAQTCRRLVLLNYFGENKQKPCNNCDICLSPPTRYDGLLDAQKVLSVIYRTGQLFSIHYVVAVLRGLNNQRIKDNHHDTLSVYGLGREQSQEYWINVIRQLIHLGFIEQHIAQHSALKLTQAARAILRGETALSLATPRLSVSVMKKVQYQRVKNYDKHLFERLRFLRKQLSEKESIPPYIVFNDATLQEMAQFKPTSRQAMLQINGVGERKLERFGAPFLQLICEYQQSSY
ncbi:DNA helicase RecQ [Pasteurellaceae bacterium HPA106]|uniref:DNA helicase RecQ n=1 Tax=Spirabiliibacterium pneumoniae TaxID=221400 RepID=UPI001AAC6E64|nr:DNA helicase RecQ [Spirabiliibacterium pneumoniae]MBE2896934.1 DNA helicase RecQ [Spirabiliibacterium pneumoniae]